MLKPVYGEYKPLIYKTDIYKKKKKKISRKFKSSKLLRNQ